MPSEDDMFWRQRERARLSTERAIAAEMDRTVHHAQSQLRKDALQKSGDKPMEDLTNAVRSGMDLNKPEAQNSDDALVKVVRNRVLNTEPRLASLPDEVLAQRDGMWRFWNSMVAADEDEGRHRAQVVKAELDQDFYQAECLAFQYLIRYKKYISDYEYLAEYDDGSLLEQEKKRFQQHIYRTEQTGNVELAKNLAEKYQRTYHCNCVGYELLEEEYIGTGGRLHTKNQMRLRTLEIAREEAVMDGSDGEAELMARKYWDNYREWPRDFKKYWPHRFKSFGWTDEEDEGEDAEYWHLDSKGLPRWLTGRPDQGAEQPRERDDQDDTMDLD